MDKQTTIGFILIGAVLIFWLYYNSPEPVPPAQNKNTDTTVVVQNPDSSVSAPVHTESDVVTSDSLQYGKFFAALKDEEEVVTIETDLAVIMLSSKGGNIQRYYLKNYNNWYSANEDDEALNLQNKVQLINYSKGGAYDLSFVTTDGKAINTGSLLFKREGGALINKINSGDSLTITYSIPAGSGGYLSKRYTFYGGKYSIHSSIEMSKLNNVISNNAYDLVWKSGINFVEENSVDEATYSNASAFYGDEQVIIDADEVGEKIEKEMNGRIDWIAVRNKYFAAMIAPHDPSGVEGAYIEGNRSGYQNGGLRENYSVRLEIPFKGTEFERRDFTVFVGPVDYDILKEYGRSFEAIVDFGSFFGLKFIVRPIAEYVLMPLFKFLHSFIPNYGFVIIVFSLIIKIVLYPLTKQSFQSMKKMQLLQPKIAELKEKYKDDPAKMNKETMKLYSTYGVNPAGGCLPLLLQMPIFVALWGLFQVAIELRQQPFLWWIHDLSRPDVIASLPFKLPLFGIDQISGLALLMGITTFIQQKQTMKDPKQAALVYIMPIMLTLMFMSFPSGLNLYYFMFNLFSIAQQSYINHKHDGMELVPVQNPKKSKGFMQKMMEAAEQQQKTAQQQKRKR